MSPAIGTTLRPVASASPFAVSSSGSGVRALIATSQPSCANVSADARPIPLLAPVTRTVEPCKPRSTLCLLRLDASDRTATPGPRTGYSSNVIPIGLTREGLAPPGVQVPEGAPLRGRAPAAEGLRAD